MSPTNREGRKENYQKSHDFVLTRLGCRSRIEVARATGMTTAQAPAFDGIWANITVMEDGVKVGGIADHYATIADLQGVADAVAQNSADMDAAWLVICGECLGGSWLPPRAGPPPLVVNGCLHHTPLVLTAPARENDRVGLQEPWSSSCRPGSRCSRPVLSSPRTPPTSSSRT